MKECVTNEMIYQAFLDCRKHKKSSEAYILFDLDRFCNLIKLKNELNDLIYEIGYSICFVVTDPKMREVFAADFRDRIVHHLLINYINEDLFEQFFIEDTYNCRKGKGTSGGIECAQNFVKEMTNNYTEDCWVLKCDIKNFFMSIQKNLLTDMLMHFLETNYKGPNKDFWINLTTQISMHKPQFKCIQKGDLSKWVTLPDEKSMLKTDPNFGLAVGNLTSQIYANFYMSPFDHYMQGFKDIRYCRYVDDFVLIGKDKKRLLEIMHAARMFLKINLGLSLHDNKWTLQKASKGFIFLGNVIKLDRRYIINRTKESGYKAARKSNYSQEQLIQFINCRFGFTIRTSSYDIRKKMWDSIDTKYKKIAYATSHLLTLKLKKSAKLKSQLKLKQSLQL